MLTWSEPMPPSEDCPYDHVVAETPLGRIHIEWKSWKDYDGYVSTMPWGECRREVELTVIVEDTLDDAKAAVQAAWDAMATRILVLAAKPETPPPCPIEALAAALHQRVGGMDKENAYDAASLVYNEGWRPK